METIEEFKSFDSLLQADERWAIFALRDTVTNEIRRHSLLDRYSSIERVHLNPEAPAVIQSQFNIARMLGIYAWLYYPLHQIAELKAFATMERALRERLNSTKDGLNRLLKRAVEQRLIVDEGFRETFDHGEDPTGYTASLPDLLSDHRNELAHGGSMLHPNSLTTLRVCAAVINQLFPSSPHV